MLKKINAILLATTLLFATACDSGADGGKKSTLKESDFEVWCADSTVSVKREESVGADQKSDTLAFDGVKNEYESAQLFITTKADILEYSLSLSDLKCGKQVVSKECFTAYREHYVEVEEIDQRETTPYSTGYYPDGLIPLDLAKKAGELTVEAGDNQGIWITVQIPKDAEAGKYTGNFVLMADGYQRNVPVELTVYDATLSDESTMQSLFLMRSDYVMTYGELDCTPEMMREYYDFLLEYRINAYNIPVASYDDVDLFVEAVKEYYDNPKVTTYGLPASSKGNGGVPFEQKAKEQVLALAKESVRGKNYLSKLVIKNGDETDYVDSLTPGTYETDLKNNRKLRAELEAAAEIVRVNVGGEYDGYIANFANVEEAATAIENIDIVDPLCYPETYIETYFDNAENPQTKMGELLSLINVWCPKTNILADEYRELVFEAAENYGAKMWWYTANNPRWPTPTYHIDNNPFGAQALSWMQRDYGVTGNLYWAVTSIAAGDDVYNDVDFPAGDGCLLYPGAKYGHYGPLPSMRLMRIRDGIEEYELLGDLEEKYAAYATENEIEDYDQDSVFDLLYSRIYSGVSVYDDAETFDAVAIELRELLAEDLDETGFFISSVSREDSVLSVNFYAKDSSVSGSGVEKTDGAGTLSRYVYTASDLFSAQYLNVTVGGKSYNRFVGGAYKNLFNPKAELEKDTDYSFSKEDEGSSVVLTAGGLEMNIASKITGDTTTDLNYTPYAQINASAFGAANFSANGCALLHLELYNAESEDVAIKIYLVSGTSRKAYGTVTLARGRTTSVSIRPDTLNWSAENLNNLTGIRFEMDNTANSEGGSKVRKLVVKDCYLSA
ncbi:MAG: DUF4091 domain-containing protein [Clostridia bacterium]|nr:DUF4091 domain-containing protein [Clostridia bacterium]